MRAWAMLCILLMCPVLRAGPTGPWRASGDGLIRIKIASGMNVSEQMRRDIEQACHDVSQGREQKDDNPTPFVFEFRIEQSTSSEDFYRRTRLGTSFAAAAVGHVLWLAPTRIVRHASDLQTVFRHECAHLWLRAKGVPRLPIIVEEAVAIGLSSSKMPHEVPRENAHCGQLKIDGFEDELRDSPSPEKVRKLYSLAFDCLWPPLSKLSDKELLPFLRKIAAAPKRWRQTQLASINTFPFAHFSTVQSSTGGTP